MAQTFRDYNAPATYSFTFPSYQSSDVKVRVDGVLKTAGIHYNINPYSTTGGGTIVFIDNSSTGGTNHTPSSGVVRIYRDTNVDVAKATYTAGASVKAADLNNNNTQLLYRAQEEQVPNLIQSYDIDDSAIETSNIKDASITTAKIADDNVTLAKLGGGALPTDITIASANIVDGTIQTADIAADAVTNAKIADNSIDSEHYVDGSIDRVHLAADIVDGTKIADDSINSEHYVDASIDEQHIANSSVTANKIADGTVGTLEIANGAVNTAKLAADAVDGTKLADNAVNSEHYTDGSIDRVHLSADIIDSTKLEDNAVNSEHYVDGSIDRVHLAADIVDGTKIADDSIDSEHIAAGALDNEHYAAGSITSDKLNGATVITSSEQGSATTNDTSFLTSAAADARFFNISSGDTIKDGQSFPDNDTTIATTAAINDRIIDIVNDVGGFDIVDSEQHFPNTNPQGQAGSAAVLSIKAASTNLVPSGTTLTIVNGNLANNANITITGVTSTIPSGFGFIVESTSTLHTYTFHRLVPKATEVTTVAGKATEIGRLGTAAAVEDMSILGTTDVVADMAILGTTDVVADMNTLATSDIVSDMNTLAVADVISDMDVVATNVTNVNNVGNNITNVNSVSSSSGANQTFTITVQNVSGNKYFIDGVQTPVLKLARGKTYTFDMSDSSNSGHPLAFRDSSDNSYTTGVTTSGTAGSSGATVVIVVAANAPSSLKYYCTSHGNAMGNTITVIDDNVGIVAGSITNVNEVGDDITNVNSVATSISNVNTVASNISSVNSFFNTYRIGANNPTTSLDTGDLFFNTTSNSLKVYTGSAWVDGVTATGNFAVVTGNTFTGSNVHNDNVKSLYGTGSDLEIYHNGTNSIIDNTNTGAALQLKSPHQLKLKTNQFVIKNSADTENLIYAAENNKVSLYYDNSEKLETTSTGIATDHIRLEFLKFPRVQTGGTDLLTFGHGGAGTFGEMDCLNGMLRIKAGEIQLANRFGNVEMLTCNSFGSVEIFHNGSKKFETQANGVTVQGSVFALGTTPQLRLNSDTNDGSTTRAMLGMATTAHNFANNSEVNDVILNCPKDFIISHGSTESMAKFRDDLSVELYFDGSKKFETTSTGIKLMSGGQGLDEMLRLDAGGNSQGHGSKIAFSRAGTLRAEIQAVKVETAHNETDIVFKTTKSGSLFEALRIVGDTKNVQIPNDTGKLQLGASQDFQIYHDGSRNRIDAYGGHSVIIRNTYGVTEQMAVFTPNGPSELMYDGSKKFETTSSGVTVTGTVAATSYTGDGSNLSGINTDLVSDTSPQLGGNLDTNGKNINFGDSGGTTDDRLVFGAGSDLQIYHNGNESKIEETGTGALRINTSALHINNQAQNETIASFLADGAVELYYNNIKKLATTANGIKLNDNTRIGLGDNEDLQIYHDGSNSFIDHDGTGNLYLRANGSGEDVYVRANDNILLQPQGGEDGIKVIGNGAVELYYDSGQKLETTSTGVLVSGIMEARQNSTDTDFSDQSSPGAVSGMVSQNIQGAFNTYSALTLVSHSANSVGMSGSFIVKNHSGSGYSPSIFITHRNGSNSQRILQEMTSAGACKLNYDGNARLQTTSDGVLISGHLNFPDSSVSTGRIRMGAADDLMLYHDGSNSYIENSTGELFIKTPTKLNLRSSSNETMIVATPNADVGLYYDNSQKLKTQSNGVNLPIGRLTLSNDNSWYGEIAGSIQHHSNYLYLIMGSNGLIFRSSGGTDRMMVDPSGNFRPNSNNQYDLGTSSYRWKNVYTNDLNLSNEGGANDIDGTWGDWTMQEGESDLFLKNNRSGKKYKFNLTEVS